MRKAFLIAIIFFLFFISGSLSGQQNSVSPGNSSKAESITEDPKPVNNNIQGTVPNIPDNNKKDDADPAKKIQDMQNEDEAEDAKSAVKIHTDNKKAEQKPSAIIKPPPEKSIIGNGLIEVNEGDFKYKRIPGISLNTEKPVDRSVTGKYPEGSNSEAKDLSEPDDKKEKRLFGIKKSTAVIILMIVLIGIIIVFKIRSKTMGGKNVLKRFPGMK